MNVRELSKNESSALRQLNSAGIESALIYLTETGLSKSILDATAPVRDLLRTAGIHDFDKQEQGQENKAIHDGTLFVHGKKKTARISLYRPKTKQGDPRLWPYGLSSTARPNDVLALFVLERKIHLVNLSESDRFVLVAEQTDLSFLLSQVELQHDRRATHLLSELRAIAARGPIPSVGHGDTAIGRTLEAALGIPMNSSKSPDYYGIELKAKRKSSKTRSNLFAQVPNWALSSCKSSFEILQRYGYEHPGGFRLYCEVSSKKPNSQGLILNVNDSKEQLQELCRKADRDEHVCVWELAKLHSRLQEKHRETFWVSANEISISGKAHFEFHHVVHTRRPSNSQFDRLLAAGEVSVDHLIKLKSGKAHEKGPLFKIQEGSRDELFLGAPESHDLRVAPP